VGARHDFPDISVNIITAAPLPNRSTATARDSTRSELNISDCAYALAKTLNAPLKALAFEQLPSMAALPLPSLYNDNILRHLYGGAFGRV